MVTAIIVFTSSLFDVVQGFCKMVKTLCYFVIMPIWLKKLDCGSRFLNFCFFFL